LDKFFFVVLVIAIAFLTFIGGAFVVLTKVFPYGYLNDAYQAMNALSKQSSDYGSPYKTNLWRPARTDARGVTRYNKAKAYNGLTLYASSHAQKAFLISMNGKVVHEWKLPIATIWENPTRELRPDPFVFWEYPHLYPNGDLLVMYVGMGDTPWGYGLVKMDKNSKVIWKYFDYVHHHLDVTEDGKIYVLTNNIRNNVIKGYEYLAPPRIDDSVVVLSPQGKRIKKVSIMDAMLRSPYGRMMRSIAWDIKQDYLHTNSIEYIDGATAAKLPFAKEGQVLLSMRDIDTVAVLDLDKEEIVWAIQGSWHRQHDADLLPNGHVMLFDNWGHYEPGGGSRVIEFDPVTMEIVWAHTGDEKHLFSSPIRSGQERLPNGNTLITESDGGRLLEVTPGGEIVWEYINPVRGGEGKLIPVLSQGVDRIEPKALDSSFLSLINRRNLPTQTSAISG
jgi:outer membrane protein assembly factor BamB